MDLRRLVLFENTDHLGFCPSIDRCMKSVAKVFGPRSVGILLSGMSGDGPEGLLEIRKAGGVTIVQSPGTAKLPYMPKDALELGAAEYSMACKQIVRWLNSCY